MTTTPSESSAAGAQRRRRGPRSTIERLFVRIVATIGIVGIGVGIGAILSSNKVQGWIIGLVVALVTFVLTGLLRSTRQMRP
ncbi:MAG TPA: hypothetical protein VKR21_08875 [Solirubrobacteraceae bacterium]|nr:hypothetical protein [Solirubrobacteraceae bacterium]